MWSYLRSSKLFIFGAIMLLCAAAAAAGAIWESGTEQELAENGAEAEATIVDKRETRGAKGRRNREVHLRFNDGAGTERAAVQSDASLWKKEIGETVSIVYLPASPETVRLAGKTDSGSVTVLAWILALVGVGCLVPAIVAATRHSPAPR